jgi:hypothetical protein
VFWLGGHTKQRFAFWGLSEVIGPFIMQVAPLNTRINTKNRVVVVVDDDDINLRPGA